MNREERILAYNKADVTKIVTKKPSNTEGSNGDIYIGNTPSGTSLFAKIENKWYEFSSNESFNHRPSRIKGSVSFINGAFSTSGFSSSTPKFIGMNGYTSTSQNLTSALQVKHALILPYDCRVVSLSIRPDYYMGKTSIYLWSAESGENILSNDLNYRGELSYKTFSMSAGYTYTFPFSAEYDFSAGTSLAIQVLGNQLDAGSGNTDANWVLTLDYDIPT
tara:strand:- start:155 stop:814 length:660 start_codon:yes stop_codon:yes gene_type:complete